MLYLTGFPVGDEYVIDAEVTPLQTLGLSPRIMDGSIINLELSFLNLIDFNSKFTGVLANNKELLKHKKIMAIKKRKKVIFRIGSHIENNIETK
jgi:hypothetical protein